MSTKLVLSPKQIEFQQLITAKNQEALQIFVSQLQDNAQVRDMMNLTQDISDETNTTVSKIHFDEVIAQMFVSKLRQNPECFDIDNLFQLLDIESNLIHSEDIEIIFQAISELNPFENIAYVTKQYPISPNELNSMEQFQQQLFKCIDNRWYDYLVKLMQSKFNEKIEFHVLLNKSEQYVSEFFGIRDIMAQAIVYKYFHIYNVLSHPESESFPNQISSFDSRSISLMVGDKVIPYIGWRMHWNTVTEFARSHIQGFAYQSFDVLYILGGPKSGKTITLYLVSIFMTYFVKYLRPKQYRPDPDFCQNITRIISLDCLQCPQKDDVVDQTTLFLTRIQWIYIQISNHIYQTPQQIAEVNNANYSYKVIAAIQNMLEKAQCYYVIYWDEIQCLVADLSLVDQQAFGNFFKVIMIVITAPCQHIVTGSSSEVLLTILKQVPQNGRSLMRCSHAVLTACEDTDQNMLLLIQHLNENCNVQAVLQMFKNVQLEHNLNFTCADLHQVLKHLDLNQPQKATMQAAAIKLAQARSKAVRPWIDQALNTLAEYKKRKDYNIQYLNEINLEFLKFMVGSNHFADPLVKLICTKVCYHNGDAKLHLRDSTLKTAMQEMVFDNQIADKKVRASVIFSILSDCQNCIAKCKEMGVKEFTEIDSLWSQMVTQKPVNKQLIAQLIIQSTSKKLQNQIKQSDKKNNSKAQQLNTQELKAELYELEKSEHVKVKDVAYQSRAVQTWQDAFAAIEMLSDYGSCIHTTEKVDVIGLLQSLMEGPEFEQINIFFKELMRMCNKAIFKARNKKFSYEQGAINITFTVPSKNRPKKVSQCQNKRKVKGSLNSVNIVVEGDGNNINLII
ncbi:Hypothetical_protein [Hexamita inflata]|uniref:Hypothetical_protein n=1 Tax=Hexamita inflata TaxID=28002 RepID=A0AA86TK21_9EUKA|nr:Hypothetical protein HINF_LOCUS8774 [Hexamita inflata]